MKLISISIERFGARSNLHLENLSPHLNVVYGPNGSGKTTITQFVRWMLFGSEDAASQRYLVAGDYRLGGTLQIDDGRGRRKTLARHLQHAHHDYVRVIGADGEEGYAFDARRLTGLDMFAWQHVFSFGFDQPPVVEQLLRSAQGNSFTVTFDESQMQRLREMVQRLEAMRGEYPWTASDEHEYAGLTGRRRQLRSELDACERRRVEQLRERERELETLLAEIAEERRRLEEARQALERTESYRAARTREADQAAAAARSQRERWLASRREELTKLDQQIQQWHQMLGRIRERHEALQAQMLQGSPAAVLAGRLDEADLRAALLSLGHALHDIDEDLRNGGVRQGDLRRSLADSARPRMEDPYDAELRAAGWDGTERADYYREILAAAWQSMRDDVHRLCRELQNQQRHAEYTEQARELDHLRRCDAELTSLIEALDRRRMSLRATPELLRSPEYPQSPGSHPVSAADGWLRQFTDEPSPRSMHLLDAHTRPSAEDLRSKQGSSMPDWTDYREPLGRGDYRDDREHRDPRTHGDSAETRSWDSASSPARFVRFDAAMGRDGQRIDRRANLRDEFTRDEFPGDRRHDGSPYHPTAGSWSADAADLSRPANGWRNGRANWNPLPGAPLPPASPHVPPGVSPPVGELAWREHDPVWQARLVHLTRRRDYLAARVRELDDRVRTLESRREALQSGRLAPDVERSLEILRSDLSSVEDRIRQLEASQRRRDEMIALERQIEQLRQQLAPSEILRDASALLARFTCGTHRAIRVSERLQVSVEDDRGEWLDQNSLSRGTRDQTYLALALALASAFRRRDVELPLVLNDVFIHIDGDRAEATAEVLAQFAAQGHQLLLFTHQEESLKRFGSLGARLYTLRERPRPLDPPTMATRNVARGHAERGYAERLYLDSPASPSGLAASPVAPVRSPASTHLPETPVRATTELGRVTDQSRLLEVDWFDPAVAERFAAAGVVTVGDFLARDAEETAGHLGLRGWDVAEMIGCQSRLMLQVFVGLSPSDAALLVACGVADPEDLAYVDVSDLHRRIEVFLANSETRARYGSIARFERSRLARWIQAARRSHYRRHRPKAMPVRRAEAPRLETAPVESARPEPLRPEIARPEASPVVPVRQPAAADSPELRVARPRRVEPTPAPRPQETPAKPTAAATAETVREPLRFFLSAADPIVDAPSIGPKTAERFHAIGLETIAQLLEVDAAEAAERINYRRITADLVQSWQQQTELVCRVPNLRGHDAQILVACDVVSAEQLADQDAAALNVRVQEYIGSVEGKRTLRGAKTPELAEVAAWIRWARHARERSVSRA